MGRLATRRRRRPGYAEAAEQRVEPGPGRRIAHPEVTLDVRAIYLSWQSILGTTADHLSATRAFLAKEKPVFTGR